MTAASCCSSGCSPRLVPRLTLVPAAAAGADMLCRCRAECGRELGESEQAQTVNEVSDELAVRAMRQLQALSTRAAAALSTPATANAIPHATLAAAEIPHAHALHLLPSANEMSWLTVSSLSSAVCSSSAAAAADATESDAAGTADERWRQRTADRLPCTLRMRRHEQEEHRCMCC